MTETARFSSGGIEGAGGQSASPLDSLFDRFDSGETSLSGEGSFEQALLDELKRSSHELLIGAQYVPQDIRPASSWEQSATGVSGPLDDGLELQNGTFYSTIGNQHAAGVNVDDIDIMDQPASSIQAEIHPQKVVFEAEVFSSLQADVHDQGGQPLNFSHNADEASSFFPFSAQTSFADDLMSGLDNARPALELPTGQVFYNGEGRPIPLSTIIDNVDAASAREADQIILPNGDAFDYDPWDMSANAAVDLNFDGDVPYGAGNVPAQMVIEGERIA